jgi:lincosamide nucleotidyltransferase A/C/D/E
MPASPRMTATDVLDVLAALREARVGAWIAGGWAVDALVGEETRRHRDLDLAVRAGDIEPAVAALGSLGYERGLDLLPVRQVLDGPSGRSVDLHPVTFDAIGHGRQPDGDGGSFEYPPSAFCTGRIDGHVVPCLGADQLVRFHLGYEPQEHDRRDMAVLRERLGVDVPEPY